MDRPVIASETPWVTCTMCGDAIPPDAAKCTSCGQLQPTGTAKKAPLAPRVKRRLRFVQFARGLIVVAVIVTITYALVSAVITGPPVFTDPLTTTGTYSVSPGNFTYLYGAITGEDYIEGNYTVLNPPGASIVFVVLNESEFLSYAHHQPYQTVWSVTGQSSGRIVFSAPYTDNFYLVFQNPYPSGSGLSLDVYVVTVYQSNVVIG